MKKRRIVMPLLVAFFVCIICSKPTEAVASNFYNDNIGTSTQISTEVEEDNRSSLSVLFDEKVMPYVKETIASFIGGGTGALAVLWFVIKASKKFNSASEDVKYTKEQKEKMEKSIKKFNDSTDIVLANSNEDRTKMEHIEKKQDAIIEVLKLTALNDPTYTKNGVAKKVENVFAKLEDDN